MKFQDSHFKATLAFILISALLSWSFGIEKVLAADLGNLSDLMTRTKVSTLSSHDISFNLFSTTTFDAGETIVIDFKEDAPDNGFAVNAATSVIADFDFTVNTVEKVIIDVDVGAPVCVNGVSNIAVGIVEATGVVTFLACNTYLSSPAGATINIEYGTAATDNGSGTNRVTNPAAPQNYLLDITAALDTGKIAIDIETEDQISVTASVDPSITFTLITTPMALGTLTTGGVNTGGPNVTTIGTNANGGYTLYVRDIGDLSNPGLFNALASYLIPSATADLDATSGYGFQCSKNSGSGACVAPYNGAVNNVGGLLLTSTGFATFGGKPTGVDNFNIQVKARAPAAAFAGSYADTLTIIAAAVF